MSAAAKRPLGPDPTHYPVDEDTGPSILQKLIGEAERAEKETERAAKEAERVAREGERRQRSRAGRSRPASSRHRAHATYLVRLLDGGRIAFRKTGKHRRLRNEDVLELKEKRDKDRRAGLRELSQMTQEFGAAATRDRRGGDG